MKSDEFTRELIKYSVFTFRPLEPSLNSNHVATFKEQTSIKKRIKFLIYENLINVFEDKETLNKLFFQYNIDLDLQNAQMKFKEFVSFFENKEYIEKLKKFLEHLFKIYIKLDDYNVGDLEYFYFIKKLYCAILNKIDNEFKNKKNVLLNK